MAICGKDIIVIGGGHAGIEAAVVSARMGFSTVLITPDIDRIGMMSCNPAIGGIGKSHLVKEMVALGGTMGAIADGSAIMSRVLNRSKGAAVRATRLQCDRDLYRRLARQYVESVDGLEVLQGEVTGVNKRNRDDGYCFEVSVFDMKVYCKKVIVCTGTFMGGLLHYGESKVVAGRAGDNSSEDIGRSLGELGLQMARFKTGTPPRVRISSVDLEKCRIQVGDEKPRGFTNWLLDIEQLPCYITYTGAETNNVIEANLDRSPLYAGEINGVGPRYCPSFEDKVVKFPERERHQIFLEPEGRGVDEFYINGLSTSMPVDVQEKMVRSIDGLESAEIMRYGYAVEYDYFEFGQIKGTMEVKSVEGLYVAGQVNGTSGYEEAAAQGMIAGINAVLSLRGEDEYIPGREQGYIGVMIDDLLSREQIEPYRLFTSRAEHRLMLREDNAAERFIDDGRRFGLVSGEQYREYEGKRVVKEGLMKELEKTRNGEGKTLKEMLRRPGVSIADLIGGLGYDIGNVEEEVLERVEIEVKYEGYLKRYRVELERLSTKMSLKIPNSFDYLCVVGLSNEAKGVLGVRQPATLDEASKLGGVTPADLLVLIKAIEDKKRG